MLRRSYTYCQVSVKRLLARRRVFVRESVIKKRVNNGLRTEQKSWINRERER